MDTTANRYKNGNCWYRATRGKDIMYFDTGKNELHHLVERNVHTGDVLSHWDPERGGGIYIRVHFLGYEDQGEEARKTQREFSCRRIDTSPGNMRQLVGLDSRAGGGRFDRQFGRQVTRGTMGN